MRTTVLHFFLKLLDRTRWGQPMILPCCFTQEAFIYLNCIDFINYIFMIYLWGLKPKKGPPHWDKHWAAVAAAVPYWAVWGVMDVFLCRRGGRWLQGSAKVQVRSFPSSSPTLSPSLALSLSRYSLLSRFFTRCWERSIESCKGVRRTFLERVLMCRQTMETYVSHTATPSLRCTVGVSVWGVILDNTADCLQPMRQFREGRGTDMVVFVHGPCPSSCSTIMISCPFMDKVLISTMWLF